MRLERRATAVIGIVALIAVPAAVLRVLCVGRSCDQVEKADRKVPFCSLPPRTRTALAAGYREGRSPDILAVTNASVGLVSETADPKGAVWPRLESDGATAPVVFWGARIPKGAEIPRMGLDDIAPSLARVLEFDVPHPEVRSGRAVVGALDGPIPKLIVEVVIRGVEDIASDPVLNGLRAAGAAAEASLESLPRDPAALTTTIGTGGVPAEHGITGSLLRNDNAQVTSAWVAARSGARPPRSVIATLADDLDEELRQRPRIGLVADTEQARGLVGGNWYVDNDSDASAIVPTRRVISAFRQMLAQGFGRDTVPDLIGVSLRATKTEGATPALHVLRVVEKAVGKNFTAAIVALPSEARPDLVFEGSDVTRSVNDKLSPVVEADTAGGLFLDQDALARAEITRDEVVEALKAELLEASGTEEDFVFADVFPGTSVAFARFC